jgi:hypothetical protein
LSLQLHAREHGQLPATLEALVKAGYLASLPADPFANEVPLGYRRDPASVREAILWSPWMDEVDQEGRVAISGEDAPATGDMVFRITVPAGGAKAP